VFFSKITSLFSERRDELWWLCAALLKALGILPVTWVPIISRRNVSDIRVFAIDTFHRALKKSTIS
jgi:hypothetical protein